MMSVLIGLVGPAVLYNTVAGQALKIKKTRKEQKKATKHLEKMGKALQVVLEDDDIIAGPSLDSFAKNMFFGMQPDLGMQILISPQENISLTRLLKSFAKEYSYSDDDLEYDDKSIVKYALGTQRTRATEYLELWIDSGLDVPENITRWYLNLLDE